MINNEKRANVHNWNNQSVGL